jgi:hypothetical protein
MAVADLTVTADHRPVPSAVWSLRLALFCGALVLFGVAMHRLLGLSTPVLLNILQVGFAGAALSVLLALTAMLRIWISGREGFLSSLTGLVIGAAILGWPIVYLAMARDLPRINDVSTDTAAPPELVAIAKLRGPGANPSTYPSDYAPLQASGYPDLQPVRINRSAEETFDLAAEAVRRLKFQIVAETPPGADATQPGTIEAVDRTLIMGFQDDIVIRVTGDQTTARVDIRSASRYGEFDFGRNAARVRGIFKELKARLDSSVPAAAGPPRSVRDRLNRKAVPKRLQGADRRKGDRQIEQGRARSDAQHAPEPRARPR